MAKYKQDAIPTTDAPDAEDERLKELVAALLAHGVKMEPETPYI